MRILILLLLLTPSFSYAVTATVVAGMNFAAPNFSYTSTSVQTTSSSGAFAIGALVGILLPQSFEFETGAILQTISFAAENGVAITNYQFKELQIPFLLRYWVDDRFGFGIGPFWGVGTGGVSAGASNSKRNYTFSDLNLFSNDFGLLFNVHAKIPIYEAFSAVLDARYLLGLEERAKDVSLMSYKTRSIVILSGISLEL